MRSDENAPGAILAWLESRSGVGWVGLGWIWSGFELGGLGVCLLVLVWFWVVLVWFWFGEAQNRDVGAFSLRAPKTALKCDFAVANLPFDGSVAAS